MSQQNPTMLVGRIVEEEMEWTLDELCGICGAERAVVVELVEHGAIEALTADAQRFGGNALRRARTAMRLQRDLGLNAAGTALALELLERIEALERQIARTR